MENPVFDGLYNQTWPKDQNSPQDPYAYVLFENLILGRPRLRQLRVSPFHRYSIMFYS
jgi:hypothetical protein